ncbi:3-oxoacyl-ACP synthase [Mariniflexile sp.]|uniref:3-oxoacyl-ACP synthase n=1 Tax=Mariniflexile sp. TaxID=1979402 RepID=UPI0040486742
MTKRIEKNPQTKQQLYSACSKFIENRHETILNTIKEIQESLTSETKSSAGDKHETGRAMLQLEREKAGNQLAEIQKVKETFSKIDITKQLKTVGLGSLVFTTQAHYFIAISAGEFSINKQTFYAISPYTPIGSLLLGKHVGDAVIFRDIKITITAII